MARGAAPIKLDDDAGPATPAAGEKANKRRCVQSACVPCRKRKSKCDGGTPVCATCTAVYKTECFYDAESESRRAKATAVTNNGTGTSSIIISSSSSSSDAAGAGNAEFLVSSIRTLPESEVYDLIQHIRKDGSKDGRLDIAALADSWRRTVTLPPSTPMDPRSLETDLSLLLGRPAMTQSGESRHFGHTSSLGLVAEDENYTRSRMRDTSVERKLPTWTTVSQDMAFVEHLLDLYFKWSHPFYVIFSRECFLKDFRNGREKYCSQLLVNSILAYACHFSDEPAARTDPENARTAGDHFFAEARRLLFEDESPSLTTTQALCVMALREPSMSRDSLGFMYAGRCMRMAIELGLHLSNLASPALGLTPSEVEVRKVTFWGCFTVDAVWSICIGRISQLPRAAITLDKPILDEPTPGLQPEAYHGGIPAPPGTVTSRMFLQSFSTLSELINDNNYMFFAPRERFTSRRLLDCYSKYLNWYKGLPRELRLEGVTTPQPHIIVLHMLYNTVIVHLFRPMLKVDLIHSNVRPRDICIESANNVIDLLRLYRSHYSMRACHLVLTHILLSVTIVHLLFSTDQTIYRQNLVEGLTGLQDLSICHHFGGRSFKIVHALSKTWNLPWPDELKNSPLLLQENGPPGRISPPAEPYAAPTAPTPTPSIGSRMGGAGMGYSPLPSAAQPVRRESLSMFAQPERARIRVPTHADVGNQLHHQNHPSPALPAYHTSAPHTQPSTVPTATTTPASDAAETLFWTPVPGMGVPILPRNYQSYPMDLNTMLGNVNDWDRFGRDGFKMSDQWSQDSMNNYNGGPGG
ncbi:hypothetical protein BS50DRAFT_461464, partial [Corynespora cassiicola Philippines]